MGSKFVTSPRSIAFIVSGMQGGGAERVAAVLCNEWAKRSCRVTLIVTYSARGSCAYHLDDGVELIYLADRVTDSSRGILSRLNRLLTLRTVVKECSPSMIVAFLTHVNVATILSCWGLNAPVIVSERTFPPSYRLPRVWEFCRRLLYPFASTVVMQTSAGLQWLNDSVPRAKGVVIPNPVQHPVASAAPFLLPSGIADRDRVVIMVGRLSKEKRIPEVIASFKVVVQRVPRAMLFILGDGPLMSELEQFISSANLDGQVFLTGRVGTLEEWYLRADCFVMNSSFEGFPNALIEAMSYGVPCISADCNTGPREIIDDQKNGVLISQNPSRAELAEAIITILSNREAALALGEAAKSVRTSFSLSEISEQWLSLGRGG